MTVFRRFITPGQFDDDFRRFITPGQGVLNTSDQGAGIKNKESRIRKQLESFQHRFEKLFRVTIKFFA